jgi:hypothetical protein
LSRQLFDASEIYRYWVDLDPVVADRLRPSEYPLLVEATLARDSETATELMRESIQLATDTLVAAHGAYLETP